MSIIVVLLMLAAVMILAYLGIPMMIVFILCSLGVMLGTGMPVMDGLQSAFMGGTAGFFQKFFIIFLLGSIFASFLELSGGAESISKAILKLVGERYIMMGIIIVTAVLAYGGISVFVVMFAIVPMAIPLMQKTNLPRYLLPGALMAGLGTFAMTGPGTPQIQNIIPMKYLGTPATAAFVPGVITALFIAVATILYMQWETKRAKNQGFGFESGMQELQAATSLEEKKLPNWVISLIPLILVIVFLDIFKWSPEASLALGVIVALILFYPQIGSRTILFRALNEGGRNAVLTIMSTALAVGFGTVVSKSPAFPTIVDWVREIGGNPLIAAALSTTIVAGVTGSASGGLGIAAPIMAEQFSGLVHPEALHRVMSVACGGLDSLPHNGFVIAMLAYLGLTHKDSYKQIFVVSVLVPLLSLIILIPLLQLFYH